MAILIAVLLVAIVGGAVVWTMANRTRVPRQPEIDRGGDAGRPSPWQHQRAAQEQHPPSMHAQGRAPEEQAPDTASRNPRS